MSAWSSIELSELPKSYSCDLILRYPGGRSDEIRPGPSVVATTRAEAFDLLCEKIKKQYPDLPQGHSILARVNLRGLA
jgi:hypothetical protein